MVPPNNLGPDLSGKAVNETQYRGMIGSLMYLTSSRPDIQFLTCLCARYQANPKESHLIVVKRIFRYLKGTPSLGLWYPKYLGFDLKGYSESDYIGCNMDKKSTSAMSSAEAEYVAVVGCCVNILWMKSQLTDYDIIYEKLPLKLTELSGEIKELKQHVKDMEIKLLGDLKEIRTKLETFASTVSSLTSQVVELKNIQWELPAELQALPVLVSSVQKQLKTLDSLPSLLNKVTEILNRFATVVENALGAMTKDVPSAGQATALPAKGEKNTTKDAKTNLQNELVDLLGIDVVEQYHNKKLLFDKYCDKMLKKRKNSKIINCDVITQKGPISLKVYREDGTIKVIVNFKVSDLHLAKWREGVQACPDRKEKGWKTIYGLIKTRIEYLDQTERELKIDFNKPLK
ncbi:hypothetical protein Tco_0196202 [Tanacetum coccineum]